MLDTVQKRELLLAKVVARSLSPNARRSFVRGLFDHVDSVGEREWANRFADLIDDLKYER